MGDYRISEIAGGSKDKASYPCPDKTVKNPETGRCVKVDGAIGKRILAMSNPKTPANLMRRALQIRVTSAKDQEYKKEFKEELDELIAIVKKHGYTKMANEYSDLLSAERDRKLTATETKEMKRLNIILNVTPTTEKVTKWKRSSKYSN